MSTERTVFFKTLYICMSIWILIVVSKWLWNSTPQINFDTSMLGITIIDTVLLSSAIQLYKHIWS